LDNDLEALCSECHKFADGRRAGVSYWRLSDPLYVENLNKWATECYGQYWEDDCDPIEVEEDFAQWLDDQH
jgi:hypothetical protein